MIFGYTRSDTVFGFNGQRSRSSGGLMLTQQNAQYLPNGKAYEVQTWYTDGARRPVSATSAVTSKVKVERSRDASDRCWPISRERNVL